MLSHLVAPFCLLLALAMVIVGFSMIAFGGPEASIELHQARASGDEMSVNVYEADLQRKQYFRTGLIVFLFLGSCVMTVIAFRSMSGTAAKTH